MKVKRLLILFVFLTLPWQYPKTHGNIISIQVSVGLLVTWLTMSWKEFHFDLKENSQTVSGNALIFPFILTDFYFRMMAIFYFKAFLRPLTLVTNRRSLQYSNFYLVL
jgi:hypothetical protein